MIDAILANFTLEQHKHSLVQDNSRALTVVTIVYISLRRTQSIQDVFLSKVCVALQLNII